MIFAKFRLWRMERQWKKHGRRNAFTWVYRYLFLHKELLEDPVYQDMFNYHRTVLINYLKKDLKHKRTNDAQLGELVDVLAGIFNKSSADRVNAYKPIVDALYKSWENSPDIK